MDARPSFIGLLQVQWRVTYALLLREIVTRYGRDHLGFIWLFLEPMLFTSLVALFWTVSRVIHSGNLPIIAFAITGYSSVLLWRNAALRVSSAVPQNVTLLYHRQIRILDLFLARTLLEIAGASCSFVVLSIYGIAAGLMDYPVDILEVLFAWGLLCWLGTSLAVFIGALGAYNEITEKFWHPISYILFPLSGAVFMVDWLPPDFQDAALLNPIVHCVEMLREGYFGNVVRTHYDIGYVVGFSLLLTLFGLAITRSAERSLEIPRLIQIEEVTKVYSTRQGPRVVLDTINLKVEKGQRVGIIGRNGAGKSTLIRLIGGVERPTRGRIHRSMSVSWPLAFGGGFHPNLTGLDNLRFICRIYDQNYRNILPFVEEFTELGAYLREPVLHYSAGMRARLAFALSMAIEFDCFLIDEIIAVGDSRFHEKCQAELFEKRKDRALIIVSHDFNTIKSHCDSASVLVDGKLQSFGQIDDAYSYYQSGVH